MDEHGFDTNTALTMDRGEGRGLPGRATDDNGEGRALCPPFCFRTPKTLAKEANSEQRVANGS